MAQSNGIGRRRVEEVLGIVGLTGVAKRRAGKFSMGMGQRLGIGVALLGDPELLIFDEPVNGLDPEGIVWIRNLMRSLAAEGRTVFVSSHLMAEMALTADHVIVIGKGRLLAEVSVKDLIEGSAQNFVRVRSPQNDQLAALLSGQVARAIPIPTPTAPSPSPASRRRPSAIWPARRASSSTSSRPRTHPSRRPTWT